MDDIREEMKVIKSEQKPVVIDPTSDNPPIAPNPAPPTQEPNVGPGAAEIMFEYSWLSKANEQSGLEFNAEKMKAEQNAIRARQQFDSQAAEAINSYYGSEYVSNQKMNNWGWNGGAMFDENSRVAWLQAGINAQLYNSMELMKAGFDSEIAIAREYAKLKNMELANQFYNDAYSRAIEMSRITGVFIAPEAQEMFDQYKYAKSIITAGDADPNSDAYKQAQAIMETVHTWAKNEFADDEFGIDDSTFEEDMGSWSAFMEDYKEYYKTAEQKILDMQHAKEIEAQEDDQGIDINADGMIGDQSAFKNVYSQEGVAAEDGTPGEDVNYVIDKNGNKYQVIKDEDTGGWTYKLTDGKRTTLELSETDQDWMDFRENFDDSMPYDLYMQLMEDPPQMYQSGEDDEGNPLYTTVDSDYYDTSFQLTKEEMEALGLEAVAYVPVDGLNYETSVRFGEGVDLINHVDIAQFQELFDPENRNIGPLDNGAGMLYWNTIRDSFEGSGNDGVMQVNVDHQAFNGMLQGEMADVIHLDLEKGLFNEDIGLVTNSQEFTTRMTEIFENENFINMVRLLQDGQQVVQTDSPNGGGGLNDSWTISDPEGGNYTLTGTELMFAVEMAGITDGHSIFADINDWHGAPTENANNVNKQWEKDLLFYIMYMTLKDNQ